MSSSIIQTIKTNKQLFWLLFGLFIIQLIFSYQAVGFLHPDQHFQIIEFSSYHLGNPNGTAPIWELKAMIRPSLQIHLFSAFFLFCEAIGVHNPFTQLTILQLLTGICMFLLFNGITLYYLQNSSKKILYISLLLLNASWSFPFVRSLFSSEIVASFLFFAGVWLYDAKHKVKPITVAILTGVLFGLAFFARFQMALAMVGWFVWLFFIAKAYKQFLLIMLALIITIGGNVLLDYWFYHQWVFTPYKYFEVNIIGGKANSFGTSSFLNYIAILAAVLSAPLFSVVLFFVGIGSVLKNWKHPIVLSVLFFLIGHCMVGHKEERFLFPIFNILPLIIGWHLQHFIDYLQTCKNWLQYLIKATMVMGIALNTFLLVVFMGTPYAQTVHFARTMQAYFGNEKTVVHCIHRSPLETESTLPLTFYQKGLPNLQFEKIESKEAFDSLQKKPKFLAVTFNDIVEKRNALDSLGYQPILYSSNMLWNINAYLASKKINTINDIWVLYQKK